MRLRVIASFLLALPIVLFAKEEKQKIAIYLAGSIPKGHDNAKETFWTEADMEQIRSSLGSFEVIFLNPACRNDDLSDQYSVFGRDMLHVYSSQIIFVDVRDRRGLGVGAEMMWAKANKIPVVAWAPQNSHYNKSQVMILGTMIEDFIHPFVLALSDQIVETLAQGAEWIAKVVSEPSSVHIKGLEHIHSAMEHYQTTQSHKDLSIHFINQRGQLPKRPKAK